MPRVVAVTRVAVSPLVARVAAAVLRRSRSAVQTGRVDIPVPDGLIPPS
jgi:hypothetical protein